MVDLMQCGLEPMGKLIEPSEQHISLPLLITILHSDKVATVLQSNKQWADKTKAEKPDLLPKLGKDQAPEILWLGCSDSRCPETTLLGLEPGEVFVHRNIANIIHPSDLSVNAVIEFSVNFLKVKHIILCGHTKCGGAVAAMGNDKLGLLDTWLLPLRTLRRDNLKKLQSMGQDEAVLDLVHLNVRQGVKTLKENSSILDAISDRGLTVHGMIYDVGTGELKEIDVNDDEETTQSRLQAFKTKLNI